MMEPIIHDWVIYDDGPRILVCICNNSYMNFTAMAFREGQVPLSLRSSVATIIAGSEGKGGGASCVFNDLNFFGEFVPNVFIHESGHALDFAQGNMYGSFGLSGTQEWSDAIDQSVCVPDPYAKSNEIEDWAQNSVLRYWAKVLGYPYDNNITQCMTPQLKFAMAALPETPAFNVLDSFRISPVNSSSLHLATANDSITDNSPLTLVNISKSPSQYWKIMPTAYDWHIACEMNSHQCIDNGRDNDEGRSASVTYRTAFISMQHKFVKVAGDVYKLVHRTSGLALSVGCPGRSTTSPVYVEDDGSSCQQWSIKSTVEPSSTTTDILITTTSGANRAMTAASLLVFALLCMM